MMADWDDRDKESKVLRTYLKEISKIPLLKPGQEVDLARRARKGDGEALSRLVEANLRFVVSFAKRYRGGGLSFLDLINEGNLGLLEAAKRFDPERGVKFITYAVWWVRQSIISALAEHSSMMRIPQKQIALLRKIAKKTAELTRVLNREPTPEEVGSSLNLPVSEIRVIMQFPGKGVPLEEPLGTGSDLNLEDVMEQDTVPPADLEYFRLAMTSQIHDILTELDDKERLVILNRFGIGTDDPKTLDEIGRKMSLSRERIRQIEVGAMRKLRRSQKLKQLQGFLN